MSHNLFKIFCVTEYSDLLDLSELVAKGCPATSEFSFFSRVHFADSEFLDFHVLSNLDRLRVS